MKTGEALESEDKEFVAGGFCKFVVCNAERYIASLRCSGDVGGCPSKMTQANQSVSEVRKNETALQKEEKQYYHIDDLTCHVRQL